MDPQDTSSCWEVIPFQKPLPAPSQIQPAASSTPENRNFRHSSCIVFGIGRQVITKRWSPCPSYPNHAEAPSK